MKYPQLVSMPSAVSDWLEEQLEARGIDSEVYTRYILSLLHAHTLEVICSEEELPFSEAKKEGGRSTVNKRLRRTSNWWRHAEADAEQLKRSAAVKCLMSATEQSCEIESLVDELCAKLKEVGGAQPEPSDARNAFSEPPKLKKISPRELAERYYAAFPALCPDRGHASDCDVAGAAASPRRSRKKQKRHLAQNRLYCEGMKARSSQGRGRYGYKKNPSKEMVDNYNNWQFLSNNNNNNNNNENNKDQSLDSVPEHDDVDMYDDLPVDISGLLDDSSNSPSRSVEMMNLANVRNTAKTNNFISCGTNITSSIWSNDDSLSTMSDAERALDFKFGSISIDGSAAQNSWPDFNSQNRTNAMLERKSAASTASVFQGFHLSPSDIWAKPDLSASLSENECLFDMLTISLMKINHNREKSGFEEIVPRAQTVSKPFNPFGQSSGTSNVFCFNRRGGPQQGDKDDLLTSERSHFKPIKDGGHREYQDGATFVISGNLDKVDYKRSGSGSMYLEAEFGQRKKYREYHLDGGFRGKSPDFVLKYCVVQNDKACQTEEEEIVTLTSSLGPASKSGSVAGLEKKAPGPVHDNRRRIGSTIAKTETERSDSVLGEVAWPYVVKSCDRCNNNEAAWNPFWLETDNVEESRWDPKNLKNIWDGEEVCQACLRLNSAAATPRSERHTQLREDISQDGEQLLSDLSSLQKSYMETSVPVLAHIRAIEAEDRKRRNSFMDNATDTWSFATRLEEDCLIKMSTLPTLRSVTL